MKVTNETKALAHEILAYWLRHNRHNQAEWTGVHKWDFGLELIKHKTLETGREVNVCKTTLCAAGTAVFLTRPPKDFVDFVHDSNFERWMNEGAKLLGLSQSEAETIFLGDNKSAKRLMKAIAEGSQKKWDKAARKRVRV